MPELRTLELPPSTHDGQVTVETRNGVVVVGANGSGKTRLGAWMEFRSKQWRLVHRVSAQKSLAMPPVVPTSSMEAAEADLLYGYAKVTPSDAQAHKQNRRWGNKPETFLLNDYQKLMVYLFSEEFEKSTAFRQARKSGDTTAEPGETKLDRIQRIWQEVLTHRELIIRAGVVEARARDGSSSSYNGAEMSDGERVMFYVIGQALAAPPNGIVVVDEPEIHLHRAVQSRLWDAVEQERPDCLFVYITHDLDFAATRLGMPKVWVKGFSGTQWDWRLLPSDTGVPEEMLLTVVGSRKPVLFCEGDRSSVDHAIYSHVYRGWTVVPCGSCEAVIHATRSFAALHGLHNLECIGIVDRDHRSDEEVAYLAGLRVFASNYSEAENMLASEAIVRAVAAHFARPDVEAIVARVKDLVIDALTRDRDRVAADLTRARIESLARRIDAAGTTRDAIVTTVSASIGQLDAGSLYDGFLAEIDRIIAERDTTRALRIYHNKGLVPQIGAMLGLKPAEYAPLLKRLAAARENVGVLSALASCLPKLCTATQAPDGAQDAA